MVVSDVKGWGIMSARRGSGSLRRFFLSFFFIYFAARLASADHVSSPARAHTEIKAIEEGILPGSGSEHRYV